MPLAFPSRSHGTVAFGFFNIESDMLLLEQWFFFADRFCRAVRALAQGIAASNDGAALLRAHIDGWRIEERIRIGDLHGAIAGVDLGGFIGATYREWPFPSRPEQFKQSPRGDQTQRKMREIISRFGRPERIELSWERASGIARLAELTFDSATFTRLVHYVQQGGYPRYRDELRPPYVAAMMAELRALSSEWAELGPADPS